jgi:hypothetical protein
MRSACFAAADTLSQPRRLRAERAVMLLSVCRPSLVTLLQWPTSRDVSEVRLLLSARSTSAN